MKGLLARAAVLSSVLLVIACDSPPLGTIGTTLLAQAAAVEKLPAGKVPVIEVVEVDNAAPASIPNAPRVHVAVARDVPWSTVDALRQSAAPGQKLAFLAATRRVIGDIILDDKLEADPLRLWTDNHGKACVSPPGVAEAKCYQRGDKKHIDRAFVRELIREAVHQYQIRDIVVELPATIHWADVVRAVDGARTCCKNFQPRVTVRSL